MRSWDLSPQERAQRQDEIAQAKSIINQYQSAQDLWGEGGMGRAVLHAGVGGFATGDLGGALGAGGTSLAAPVIHDISNNLDGALKYTFDTGAGMAIGGLVGGQGGMMTGANTDWHNRQLHPREIELIGAHAKDFAEQQGISEAQARGILASTTLSQIDEEYSYLINDTESYRAAQSFLQQYGAGKTFIDEYGRTQTLFDERGNSNYHDFAMNMEYVYSNDPIYDGVSAKALAFAGNTSKEILLKSGTTRYQDMVSQPTTVQKLTLNNLLEARSDIVEELEAHTEKTKQEHNWEREFTLPLIDTRYVISGTNQGQVNQEDNSKRLNLQTISTMLGDSYSSIYSLAEPNLSPEARKMYQIEGNLLSGLEGLAAAGALENYPKLINRHGVQRGLITQGQRQAVQEVTASFSEMLNRGWDGRLGNYEFNPADGTFIGIGGGKLINTGVKDAITGDYIFQRINKNGQPYGSYVVINHDGAQRQGVVKPDALIIPKVDSVEDYGYRRPYLRKQTIETIEAGYIKLPNGDYQHKVTRNIVKGPIDIGHAYGREHRRLALAAKELNMTQKQFNDYVEVC